VPSGFQVDQNARYTGTVQFYAKWKGYGFIEVTQQGVVPNNKLFVHWRQLQSDDRFPTLVKGLEVEFGVMIAPTNNFRSTGNTLRAKNVTMVGGMNLAMQDDLDAQEKVFVGGQHLRYTGQVKFFTPKHGFGYVVMDQGYDVDPTVPSELRVDTAEVNAGGRQPVWMENLAVEFGIYRDAKMKYKVYNMTLPGGHPLTQDALENRISMGPQTYSGEVAIWNWRGGWGFIRVEPSVVLPPRVMAKLAQQAQAAKARGRTITQEKMLYFRKPDCAVSLMMNKGCAVTFQIYIDDKGAGATEVNGQ
jgi:cold shock CspA family protein